ncbi:MAG: asparagine synthase (glutamine-hydrolyzing) [Rhizobiales bacterium]|nr:asparagine synthase (glutamine-hydrolyzing) [Hyphomicrobiales bacterium]
MCRIFGTFGLHNASLTKMAFCSVNQNHGGPDEQSIIIKPNWSLGINRLSIQDISGGGQPYTMDDRIYAVFNGEIYNHLKLREKLHKLGYKFKSNCDGAIIPAMYTEYGEDFVSQIEGMFSIALIDNRSTPKLFLACDQLSMKSVYYIEKNGQFSFSSELDGLKILDSDFGDIDSRAIDLYFSMRAIVGERTIFKNVQVLEPGTIKTISFGEKSNSRPFNVALEELPTPSLTFKAAGKTLKNLLDIEVQRMLQTDAPTCVVVSGGLDSSLISALAARRSEPLSAFHLAYKGNWPQDERKFATEHAKKYGLNLEVVEADPNIFPDILPDMVKHLGQPNSAPHSLSTYLLFQEVAKNGFKVALTGEGADEQFGGYNRFAKAYCNKQSEWADLYLDTLAAIPKYIRNKIYTSEFNTHICEKNQKYYEISTNINSLKMENRLDNLLQFDLFERFPYYILRRVDHLSMAHGVEVRMPFCQPSITSFAKSIPDGWKIQNSDVKRVVYEASRGLVPNSILNRSKQPFTLPVATMIQPGQKLFDYIYSLLTSQIFKERDLFRSDAIEGLFNDLAKGPNSAVANTLWTLAILEIWLLQH